MNQEDYTRNAETFILLSSWMRKDLDLKDKHLIVFGLIYGFSQDGESEFYGSLSYIADWVGAHQNTVRRVLKDLVERGLINRREQITNGVLFVRYSANLKRISELRGGTKMVQTPYQNSITPLPKKEVAPTNLVGNNKEDNKKKKYIQEKPDNVSNEVWEDWKKLRKTQRAPITPLVLKNLKKEGEKAGMSLEDVLTYCVTNGYRGFKASWVTGRKPVQKKKTEAERNFDVDYLF